MNHMIECDPQLLSACLDGELSPEQQGQVREHLRQCPACARELRMLEESSRLIHEHPFEELDQRELSDLHRAVNQVASEQTIWRLGLVLGALAASILVISSAWLMEIPAPSAGRGRQRTVAIAPASQWERVAMTLRADPLPPENDAIQLADAGLADWMLQGLSEK
jgi:anti-sigma factor RsiW